MIIDTYFEDYEIGSSRETFGRTITETDIITHAGHSGDFFPHHVDVEFCKAQPFKRPIAHGTMTFAIGVGLTASVVNPQAMTYGYDRLRFPNPVYAGDTIKTRITVVKKDLDAKRSGYGRIVEKKEVTNQEGLCVLYAEHVLLVKCRES